MSDSAAFIAFSADYAYYSFVATMTSSLFYGIFLVLTAISLSILWTRPQELSHPLRILRWTIVSLTVISTAVWTLQSTANLVLTVKWRQLASSELPLEEHIDAIDKAEVIPVASATVLRPFAFVIAAAIPIWRAYVLWSNSKLVQTLLLFVFFVNAVLCVAQAFIGLYLVARDAPADSDILTALYAAQFLVSTITNAIATAFIGVMAWKHKSFIREHQAQQSSPTSSALHILLLLVEAGVLLCFAQTLNVALAVAVDLIDTRTFSNPLSLAQLVFSNFGEAVAAAYPSLMVIILFLRGSTLGDNTTLFPRSANDAEAQQGRSTTIEFAPVESSAPNSLSTRLNARGSNKEVQELRDLQSPS